MRKQGSNLLDLTTIIFCMIIFVSCSTPPASVSQSNNDIQDIRVQMVEPESTTSKVEQFPLPNCGGNEKLAQSLGTFASISQSATVGAKATVTGGGEVQIPEAVKLKLEIQVELAYQRSFESANSRVDSIEMSASPSTHVVYTILWEEQTFTSIVQYSMDGKVYETPYMYRLSVPKIDTSYSIECPSNNSTGETGETNAAQPTIQPIVGNLLFNEDFEDNVPHEFFINDGEWEIVEDGSGNKVFEASNLNSFSWPSVDFGPSTLKDYAVEFRVRLMDYDVSEDTGSGMVILSFRRNPQAVYGLALSPYAKLVRVFYAGEETSWGWMRIEGQKSEANFDVQKNIWYTVRLEVQGERIQVYIDGNLFLSLEDNRLGEGNISQLGTGPDTIAQFDDVQVWTLGR